MKYKKNSADDSVSNKTISSYKFNYCRYTPPCPFGAMQQCRAKEGGSLVFTANYSSKSINNKYIQAMNDLKEVELEGEDVKNESVDWATILGRKGNKIYAHELAKAQIHSNKPLTVKVLNKILAYSDILVSEDTLNSLINIPRLVFNDLHKKETRNLIDDKVVRKLLVVKYNNEVFIFLLV